MSFDWLRADDFTLVAAFGPALEVADGSRRSASLEVSATGDSRKTRRRWRRWWQIVYGYSLKAIRFTLV
jgi:hypothetical protein